MSLTKAQAAAVNTLLDYLAETTRPGHTSPPKHAEAHNALVLLAVAAGHDGNDADARLAATWRDRLNVQRDLAERDRLAARVAELEGERDEARRIASGINRGAVQLHDVLRVTLASVYTLIDSELHTPDRVRRYLATQGWTHVRDTATGSDWTWGTPVAQWASVPGSTHYSDYARRIAIIVVDAADVHGTGELRVLADIQEIDCEPMPDWLTAAAPDRAEGSEQ